MKVEDKASYLIWKLNGKPRRDQVVRKIAGIKQYENLRYPLHGLRIGGDYEKIWPLLSFASSITVARYMIVVFLFSSLYFSAFLIPDINIFFRDIFKLALFPIVFFIIKSTDILELTVESIKGFIVITRTTNLKKEIDSFIDSDMFYEIYKNNENSEKIRAFIKKGRSKKSKEFFDFRDMLISSLDHKWWKNRKITKEDLEISLYYTIYDSRDTIYNTKIFDEEARRMAKAELDARQRFRLSFP